MEKKIRFLGGIRYETPLNFISNFLEEYGRHFLSEDPVFSNLVSVNRKCQVIMVVKEFEN